MEIADKLDELDERITSLERRAKGSETLAKMLILQLIRQGEATGRDFDYVELIHDLESELGEQVAGNSPDDREDFMAAYLVATELVNGAALLAQGIQETNSQTWNGLQESLDALSSPSKPTSA